MPNGCTCGEAWRGHPQPHALTCPLHVRQRNPLVGLWAKRNTSSGHFTAIKRSGDVFKGVRREN